MNVNKNQEPAMAHGFQAPVTADSVLSPIVVYDIHHTSVNFPLDEEGWGRVTFEKLDSIRVCRGEYLPYVSDWKEGDPFPWVYTIHNSPWLRERYEYEKRYYGSSYEFGGDVDEMATDFSHYLFCFHDQFVEALSSGVWFEQGDEYMGDQPLTDDHPSQNLPVTSIIHSFTAHGIRCQVRQNVLNVDELLHRGRYCSQKLWQFAAELGSSGPSWTVSLRVRNGKTRVDLKSYFGKIEAQFDRIPHLSEVQPRIESWLGEVRDRRRKMGKD